MSFRSNVLSIKCHFDQIPFRSSVVLVKFRFDLVSFDQLPFLSSVARSIVAAPIDSL